MNYYVDPFAALTTAVFVFSAVFWYTSKQPGCWYRRYMVPLMVASFALVLPLWVEKAAVLISAVLVYDGYKGYGREKLEEEKEKQDATDSNNRG